MNHFPSKRSSIINKGVKIRPIGAWGITQWVGLCARFQNHRLREGLTGLAVCMGWVEGIFWPNPPWWVKKNSTQLNPSHKSNPTLPNPHELGWVGLNPWVGQFFLLLLLLNWAEKNITHLPHDLINKIYINI